jgi:GrpB-like predicted nucleotidyltransferase (UPF0157 family)
MASIVISPARASWRRDFETLKRSLSQAIPEGSRLHHIGSTAVNGLPAKDVIDLQLTVNDLNQVDDFALANAGFRRIGTSSSDHCPLGLNLNTKDLEKRFYQSDGRAANLHVRETGRFNQRYALLCRDFLRSHEVAARAYARIKERLAQQFPNDEDGYYEIKDPVCDIIIAGANEWAVRTGWREPPPD